MTATDILARGFIFEVNDGTTLSPDWLEVEGVNSWSHSPSSTNADTSKFSNAGRTSHMKTSRGDEFTLNGLAQEDPDTGERAPGQLACETWAQKIGYESRQQFRITSPGGNVKTFDATAEVTPGGGGIDDPSAWSLTVTVDGAVVDSEADEINNAPTSVAGTNGILSSVISFTDPSTGDTPTLYEVVVVLSADTTSIVKTVTSSAKPVLVSGLTASVAVKAKVRARNGAGWGPYSALSAAITPTAS